MGGGGHRHGSERPTTPPPNPLLLLSASITVEIERAALTVSGLKDGGATDLEQGDTFLSGTLSSSVSL